MLIGVRSLWLLAMDGAGGLAFARKGMGADVIVTEIDPTKRLKP